MVAMCCSSRRLHESTTKSPHTHCRHSGSPPQHPCCSVHGCCCAASIASFSMGPSLLAQFGHEAAGAVTRRNSLLARDRWRRLRDRRAIDTASVAAATKAAALPHPPRLPLCVMVTCPGTACCLRCADLDLCTDSSWESQNPK